MYAIAVAISFSIFLLAVGKASRVDKLWLLGSLFTLIITCEILEYLGFNYNVMFYCYRFDILSFVSLFSFVLLVCLASRISGFEERFITYIFSPFVFTYIFNIYIGIIVGVITMIILATSIIESVFVLNKVQGILIGIFIGGLIGEAIIMWAISPLALSALSVFLFAYILREARDSVTIREISRSGMGSLTREDERILYLIGFLEGELESSIRLISIDEAIYICSRLKILRLDETSKKIQAIIKNKDLKELYEV